MGLSEHKLAILKIVLFTIIFLYIISYLIITHYRTYIINNWSHYRNNPFIIPFAGFLRKDGEKRGFLEYTKHNFKSLHWTLNKGFFGFLIKPIQYILEMITSVIYGFTNTLNIFRKQAKIIRKMFAQIVQSTANKMTNLQLEILKIFSIELPDSQLIEIRDMLSKYFADKASDEMDRLWEENNWDDKTMEDWSNEHMRTKYE